MSAELAEYLEQALREGRHDSRGQFSVDLERAKQLLGGTLFEDPANYLLKIVQAACLCEPEEIRITIHGDTLQVDWRPDRLSSQIDELESALLDRRAAPTTPFSKQLLLGLQAAGHQGERIVWAQRDVNGVEALIVSGGNLTRFAAAQQGSVQSEYIFQIRRRAGSGNSWAQWVLAERNFAGEVRRLEACRFSPVPIYLNLRLISHPRIPRLSVSPLQVGLGSFYDILVERLILSREPLAQLISVPPPAARPAASYDFGHGVQPLGLGRDIALYQWRSFLSREEGQLFPAQPRPTHRATPGGLTWNLFKNPGEVPLTVPGTQHVGGFTAWTRPQFRISRTPLPALDPLAGQAYLVAPCQPSAPHSTGSIVQHGVMLKPLQLDLALPGMWILVADAAAKTDLSGLQPLEDERLECLRRWLTEESESMRKDARRTLRFGEKLGMNQSQLRELRRLHEVEQIEY